MEHLRIGVADHQRGESDLRVYMRHLVGMVDHEHAHLQLRPR